tara:strand:- start:23 stop:541 length:519 start_codon:yes stop_codon:yes gene_type:complete
MVLQGIHLWDSGYNFGEAINYQSGNTARLAVKGRGKGGIVLLIFMLFRNFTPQLIIFGYGYIALKNLKAIKDFYRKFINGSKLIVSLQDELIEKDRLIQKIMKNYLKELEEKGLSIEEQQREIDKLTNKLNKRNEKTNPLKELEEKRLKAERQQKAIDKLVENQRKNEGKEN